MEKKISLVFHPSYYEALEDGEFTQEEKGDILDALCRFQFYGEMPEFTNPKYKMFWKLVFPSINTSAARYKAAVENGKKGGAPKGTEPWNKGKKSEPKANQTTNLTQTQHEPKAKQDIEIENEIEKENEIDINNNIENDDFDFEGWRKSNSLSSHIEKGYTKQTNNIFSDIEI